MTRFRDYRPSGHTWITIVDRPFYPDTLDAAVQRFEPIIERFGELLEDGGSSADLLRAIQDEPSLTRGQLLRVFRKFASPDTPVEMLKRKTQTETTISNFGDRFRDLDIVRQRFAERPTPDEALIAVLDEHRDRGSVGYELTENFFAWFDATLASQAWTIEGPVRAGRDVNLRDVLEGYPISTPADFVIRDPSRIVRAIGFARYDSDRGGAQEDDRTGGNARRLREILDYADDKGLLLKVVFVNDGPGLLLGSMWEDYARLEETDSDRCMVVTLKMLTQDARLTIDWLDD